MLINKNILIRKFRIYTLYTNEIALVHKLMKSVIFTKINNQLPIIMHNIGHLTINYVDDPINVFHI